MATSSLVQISGERMNVPGILNLVDQPGVTYGKISAFLSEDGGAGGELDDATIQKIKKHVKLNIDLFGSSLKLSEEGRSILHTLVCGVNITLGDELGQGGEASVHALATNVNQVAISKLAIKVPNDGIPSYTPSSPEVSFSRSLTGGLSPSCAFRVEELSDSEEYIEEVPSWLADELAEARRLSEEISLPPPADVAHAAPQGKIGLVMRKASSSMADDWKKNLSVEQRIYDVTQVCEQVVGFPYVHRDLKPANILKVDGVYKLADFSFCKEKGAVDFPEFGTVVYCMPPETIPGDEEFEKIEYTSKIDSWSIGMMLFEAITGALPVSGDNVLTLAKKIGNGSYREAFCGSDGLEESWESYRDKVKQAEETLFNTQILPQRVNSQVQTLLGDQAVSNWQCYLDDCAVVKPILEKSFSSLTRDDLTSLRTFIAHRESDSKPSDRGLSSGAKEARLQVCQLKSKIRSWLEKAYFFKSFDALPASFKEICQSLLEIDPKNRMSPEAASWALNLALLDLESDT